ncbi:MAG: DUF1566 domain-containing protein [Tannerellaceae bacterium]|nr:DUF1566 domain-containing protein [Tannerellaceae bacterium]
MSYNKSTGTYTVAGGGENLWAQADEFFMVWKKEIGDISISSTLAFENKEGNTHKKMGLMIRESQAADARYVDVAVHGDGLTSLQYRTETGGITREITVLTKAADHVVLTRNGNKFTIKTATGEYPRQTTAEIKMDFPDTYYIGLFVCAHEAGVARTAYFSDVVCQKQPVSVLHTSSGEIQEGSVIYDIEGKTPAGIVFQYNAATGHGYMVSLEETQAQWGETGINLTGLADHINSAVAGKEFTGNANTLSAVAQLGTKTNYAARWCHELRAGGYEDWYLPSCGELNMLLTKRAVVNNALQKTGAQRLSNAWHWSSSEGNDLQAWSINLAGGDIYSADKSELKCVRAIRAFWQALPAAGNL